MGFKTVEYVTNKQGVVLLEIVANGATPTCKIGDKYTIGNENLVILDVHEVDPAKYAGKILYLQNV